MINGAVLGEPWAPQTDPLCDADLVEAMLDIALLVEVGWDAGRERFRFVSDNPVVGWRRCRIAGCGQEVSHANGLCTSCHARMVQDGTDVELFLQIPRDQRRRSGFEQLCRVCRTAGHERPVKGHGPCGGCHSQMRRRGQSADGYVNGDDRFPPASPRPSFGDCVVVACDRLAATGDPVMCDAHRTLWVAAKSVDLDRFCRETPPMVGDLRNEVWVGGLPRLVSRQVLFGIQRCVVQGRQVRRRDIQRLCTELREAAVLDLAAAAGCGVRTPNSWFFINFTVAELDVARRDKSVELRGDVWNLRLWDERSTRKLDFRRIVQPWLREAAKCWVGAALAKGLSASTLSGLVLAVTRLAEHLERVSPGATPAALDLTTKERFLAELMLDETSGRITREERNRRVTRLRQFARDASRMGLCDPGGPLWGIAGSFQIGPDEVPLRVSSGDPEDEIGRGLPESIIAQLLRPSNLDLLAPMWQRMIRLAIDTGRRPAELCRLRFNCLDYDLFVGDDGSQQRLPVLVHDQPKVSRRGVRLAITGATATTIMEQQAAVRDAYPATPAERLVLFPRANMNPSGEKISGAQSYAYIVATWRRQLTLFDAVTRQAGLELLADSAGNPIAFPVERVFAYSFRHTYAQRHIDAGVAVPVLADLMGHSNINTTQGYYKIRTRQKREALEKVTRFTVTVRGAVMTGAASTSQAQRIQLGSVGVPMGSCGEPSNVKAHGRACPFRHRCFGCAHFRTDLSHLPDLRAYLNQLLVAKEELADINPDIAEWARRDATPSDEEIATVRGLIDACENLLDQLPASERQELLRHIETLRETRQHLLDAVPVAFLNTVAQPAPTLFPNLEGGSFS